MPARRTQGLSADLFATAAATKAPPEAEVVVPKVEVVPTAEPSLPRHLLPKDLPGALKRLNDSELDALLEATIDELKGRDRLPPRLIKETLPHASSHPRQPPADDGASSLTKGQLNAVRAAFKAGVKPAAIARQFGISQSNVRKALASDARDHKSGR